MTDELRFSRSQRRADRNFASPRRPARHHQSGDVHAGDQQHESDGAHQRLRHDAIIAQIFFAQGNRGRASDRVYVARGNHGFVDAHQVGQGLFALRAGLQPADAVQKPALVLIVGIELQRNPHFGFVGENGRFRKHADDGERLIVEPQNLAGDILRSGEFALPQSVAQQRDLSPAFAIL